jgi:hypothetical protein
MDAGVRQHLQPPTDTVAADGGPGQLIDPHGSSILRSALQSTQRSIPGYALSAMDLLEGGP